MRSFTVGIPGFRIPPSGLGISTRLTGSGVYFPLLILSISSFWFSLRYAPISSTVIPSIPGAPLFAFTLLKALLGLPFSVSPPRVPAVHCPFPSISGGKNGALSHTLHVPRYLFASSYLCFLYPMFFPPFPVVLKTPVDSVLHLSTTTTSADFCTFSTIFRSWLSLSGHSAQTSPGTTRLFLSIYLPHLPYVIPCGYWASTCSVALPSRMA